MKVLGIETATAAGGAALVDDGRMVAEVFSLSETTHSSRLLPAIDQLFKDVGWRPLDIGLVAVSIGPGSFTGLRIGLAAAKGIAVAAKAEIIGVPTLEAFAYHIAKSSPNAPIRPVLDARKAEVFTAAFEKNGKRLTPDENIAPQTLAENISNEKAMLAGGGFRKYESIFIKALGKNLLRPASEYDNPHPSAVAELGLILYRSGTRNNVETLAPLYVRGADAVIKPAFSFARKKKQAKRKRVGSV